MAYLSLYRKYRPQKFADVAGQDHVVQTLQNALSSGRIANGYLFCGTRGVAKTTIARIFAKCLNCIGPDGAQTTPTPEPCDVCIACRTISAGQCVDVVEMDAASNRSVADIAKLREGVQFGPMENRFKTYIVDEAHQLSSDAKDAFLKTLEEPPANVVFILATTEAHAIPVTIASRCQHFEFKRGSLAQIARRVAQVLEMEGVSMEADAVLMVSRAAEGSYRDSLSLLEQVLAYKREGITAHDVAEVLGTVQADILGGVVDAIAASDAAAAFAIAEQVFASGKDVRQFFKSLSARFRDMLFVSVGATQSLEDAGSMEDSQQMRKQAALFSPAALLKGLEVLSEAERETRFNNQHRLLLEMALLKLMDMAAAEPSEPPGTLARPAALPRPPATRPPVKAQTARPEPASEPKPVIARALSQEPDLSKEVADEEEEIMDAVPEPASAVGAAPAAGEARDDLSHLQKNWRQVVNHMQATSPGGVPVVNDAKPIELAGKTFKLVLTQKAFADKLNNPRARERVEDAINKVMRSPAGTYRIKGVLQSDDSAPLIENSPPKPAPLSAPEPASASLDLDEGSSELLDEVIAVFGGKIIEGK